MISELARQYLDCGSVSERARWLMDLPLIHLADAGLGEVVEARGTMAERAYRAGILAWLHATRACRRDHKEGLEENWRQLSAVAERAP